MKLLKNKTALITGGSTGIGFATAQAFAEQGANIILIGRDIQKLEKAKNKLKQYKTDIITISKDISRPNSAGEIYELINAQKIQINIIVNNAGIARFTPFADTDEKMLDYHFALNVKSPYLLTQAFLNHLIQSNGNIINISSYFAKRMLPDRPSTAYSLTKGAIDSFTKALAFELGPQNVRVNAIAPGTVATDQVEKNFEKLDQQAKNRFQEMIKTIYPLQKTGEPKDIANTAVFLASDLAKWITGSIFAVDGGLTTN